MVQPNANERIAPLKLPVDRTELIRRATEASDGCISVGGMAYGDEKRLVVGKASPAFAQLVELLRRELKQSVEELALQANLDVTDVIAIELGDPVPKREVVERLAVVFRVEVEPLLQLAGLVPASGEQLPRLAALFSARLESNEPLEPREEQVLEWFRKEAFPSRRDQVEVR
jgi:transcriptional regulator with XRE-family HTH domain